MSVPAQIALVFGAVAALLGFMAAIRALALRLGWGAEPQRKLIHVATGLFVMSLPWVFAEDWPIYLLLGLALLVMAALRLPALRGRGPGAALHGVERQSAGDIMLAVSVGLILLLSEREPVLYLLPLALVTLADAAAALAGSAYGRRFFQVAEGRKSFEGTAIFFLVASIVTMSALLLLTEVGRGNVILLALVIAAFAALVEADSWQGLDNLFLPVGVLFFLFANIDATRSGLLLQTAIFVLALVFFRATAPLLGLSDHAARVYVVAVFLILSATAPQNALLPILMLAAHLWVRLTNPSREAMPDLNIVAVMALIGFGYQALGFAAGPNALSFYNLSAAAMAAGLASLAVAGRGVFLALALRLFAVGALLWLWSFVASVNPASVHWHGLGWRFALAVLSVAAFVPALRPGAFAEGRSLRLAAVALPLPLGAYLFAWSMA